VDASFSSEFIHKIKALTQAKLLLCDAQQSDWDQLFVDSSRAQVTMKSVAEDALLEIIYTSGTTGEPKGVMITHGNVLSNLIPIWNEYQKYRRYAIPFSPLGFVHLIPLSHLFGQIMGLFIPQMLAGKVIFSETSPPVVMRAAKRNRASAVICVPKELAMLRRYTSQRHDVAEVKDYGTGIRGIAKRWWKFRKIHHEFGWKFWAFIVGGATLPLAEETFWSRLGFAVIQGYGLTETAPSVTITHPFKGIKKGSVGKALPGLEVKIAEDGEILVRGPNVSPGYYRNEQATAEVYKDGWLHTGDIGRFDEQGNLQLLGRKKEVIVTAEGLNIYPDDVEAVLNSDPRVRESAVVAKQFDGVTTPHAVLVPAEGVTPDQLPDIMKLANSMLEAFQRIHSYSIWPQSHLPRTTTGKLKRLAIADGTLQTPEMEQPADSVVARLLEARSEDLAQKTMSQQDLGLSSLDRVELLVQLEQKSGIVIDEAEFAKAQTVGDVAKLVLKPPEPIKHYPYGKWPQWFFVRWIRFVLLYGLVFPMLRVRIKVLTSGLENLRPLQPPVLFVANHQSILDAPVIFRALPFAFRHSLAPAMGTGRTAIERSLAALFFNTYPLPRTSVGLREAIHFTGDLADRGYSPLVFPEGERTEDGKLMPFRPGIGVIARQLELPVVPVLIRGLFEIWPVFARGPRIKGDARIFFGSPFVFGRKDPGEITAQLESWFQANY
ncbi:MAG TPA: AMP-binding protein, partial [Acidobacteriota bacterium]|nr:AMP-binding protein [Acidobacteriota bacterium]